MKMFVLVILLSGHPAGKFTFPDEATCQARGREVMEALRGQTHTSVLSWRCEAAQK